MSHEVVFSVGEFYRLQDATPLLNFTTFTKDLSPDNGVSDGTEIVRVASLSATFEGQRRF